MDKKVRVRYAPSPTGFLHIGNAQSALFNYLFARHFNGTMVLRIEDTDIARNVPHGEESQMENLHWLGVDWDEGPDKPNPKYAPYHQTERNKEGIYHKYVQKLIDEGKAYYDYTTEEELQKMREKQKAKGETPRYDGHWYDASDEEIAAAKAKGIKPSVRLHLPKDHTLEWDDWALGHVSFNSDNLGGDFVIEKNNGMPTYNFAVVIDDYLMDITDCLRGADHIANTPKQIAVYEALGVDHPHFCHISLIFNPATGKKLSKRDKNTLQFISQYHRHGYLKEAIFNFIAFLGWSPVGEKEIYSKEELIKAYDPNRMSNSPAYFDQHKLDWMNGEYIKKMSVDDLVDRIMTLVHENDSEEANKLNDLKMSDDDLRALLKKVVHIHQRDVYKLIEIMDYAWFYATILDQDLSYDDFGDLDKDDTLAVLNGVKAALDGVSDDTTPDAYNDLIKKVGKDAGVKGQKLYFPLNIAFTGKSSAPQINEIMAVYPVSTSVKLLDKAIAALN